MFVKKISSIIISVICFTLILPCIAYGNQFGDKKAVRIPTTMEPGSVITYDINNNPNVTKYDNDIQTKTIIYDKSNPIQSEFKDVVDNEGRKAEDEFCEKIKEDAKKLPKVNLGWDLPEPQPGMIVIYGSDGHINHIYNSKDSTDSVTASRIPSNTVKYPGRLPVGVYTFGTNQKVTITDSYVLGEGRFTVFRAGVGGSGTVGSSGKTLGIGDVATKRQIDNPRHNTTINARALDTNVLKIVYKNDIGSLPDAVMDVYFWNWTDKFFGYKYSDTLSFSGRYFYKF